MKTKLFASLLVLLFLAAGTFAQKPGNVLWNDNGWATGITNVSAIDNMGKGLFVIGKSQEGIIEIHEFRPSGDASREAHMEKLSTTDGFEKGIWAIDAYRMGQQHYLFISYANNGKAAIYKINEDYTIGEKTWETSSWEKNIKHACVVQGRGSKFLFLMRNDTGWAWVFRLTSDGKVDRPSVWSTKSWVPGIEGVSPMYNGTMGGFVMLTHPNGKAWMISLGNDGNLNNHVWSTSWAKNITAVSANHSQWGNYFILSDPSAGRAWSFKVDEYGDNREHIWKTEGWEKGISIIETFEYNLTNECVLLIKPNIGMAWIFEIVE